MADFGVEEEEICQVGLGRCADRYGVESYVVQ